MITTKKKEKKKTGTAAMVPDENGRVSLVDTAFFLISKFQFHVLVLSVSSFLSAGYILCF